MTPAAQYLARKLAAQKDAGGSRITKAVMAAVFEYNRRGVFNSSMRSQGCQEALKAAYLAEIHDMAKLVISVEAETDPTALDVLQLQMRNLENATYHLRSYCTYSTVTMPEDALQKLAAQVLDDVQQRVVGTERLKAEHAIPAINVTATQSPFAINSPGANVQQAGRDAVAPSPFDAAKVEAMMTDIVAKLRAATVDPIAAQPIVSAAETVAAEAKTKEPDRSTLKTMTGFVLKRIESLGDKALYDTITTRWRDVLTMLQGLV